MKSIVDKVLKESAKEKSAEEEAAELMTSSDDEELRKLVESLQVKIRILGCGGGGSNTINRLYEEGITGADLIALNTDAKHLLTVKAHKKILTGKKLTRGLGAGAIPEVGEKAAQEAEDEIEAAIGDADIVFVTAGMGGGTGTGTAFYVARKAKEKGALVMSVVTLPFKAEGAKRMENAIRGVEKLRRVCDTTIVIPNDKLLELVPRMPLEAAFKVADEILMQSIKGLTEIITKPGLVNLDYNDVRTVMEGAGMAIIGIGESESTTDRVDDAMTQALTSPLLGEVDISEGKGALVRVVGGPDMTVAEAEKAAKMVSEKINPQARIIWGCSVEPELENTIRVLVVITGVRSTQIVGAESKSFGGNEPESEDLDFVS